jgi:uncharacterized protein
MRNSYMLIAISVVVFSLALGAPASSPDTQPSAADHAPQTQPSQKEKDIRKLLEISGSAKLADQVFQQVIGQFRQSFHDVPPEFWDRVQAETNMDDLMEQVIPIYDRHFSDDDIKGLISFYQSPVGRKLVAEMPQVVSESMMVGQQWGRSMAERVMDRLKQKGYLKT